MSSFVGNKFDMRKSSIKPPGEGVYLILAPKKGRFNIDGALNRAFMVYT